MMPGNPSLPAPRGDVYCFAHTTNLREGIMGFFKKRFGGTPKDDQRDVIRNALMDAYIAASKGESNAGDRIVAEAAAKLGDPTAMHNLGVKYRTGDGVPQ